MLQIREDAPLLVISGIPGKLHVPDLRAFFAPGVEADLFECFHFRRLSDKDGVAAPAASGKRRAATSAKSFAGAKDELDCVAVARDVEAAARILCYSLLTCRSFLGFY